MAAKECAILRAIRDLANKHDDHISDRELLARFVTQRNEDAFKTLVRRHGRMVMGVGLRVLHHRQDAEDVCQATFLLLARKAKTTAWRDSVANWLYGVAHNLARKARDAANRRRVYENRVPAKALTDALADITLRDLQAVFDQELARLPKKYRAPILLCCLEGKARDEAARCLGLPPATVKSRLEEGRELLRRRLAGRGLLLSVALAGHTLLSETAHAGVSPLLVRGIAQAAVHAADGPLCGVVSSTVAALVNGGVRAMFLAKLKVTSMAVLLVCLTGVGTAALTAALTLQAAQGPSPQEGGSPRARKAGAPNAAAKARSASAISHGAAHDAKPAWREMLTMKHEHAITALACSREWSVAGDEGGHLFAWDTKTGKHRRPIGGGGKTIDRLQFTAGEKDQYTPDGKSLYVVCGGGWGIFRYFVKDKKFQGGHGFGGGDSDGVSEGKLGVSADAEIELEFLRGSRAVYLRRNAYVFKMGKFEVRPDFNPNHHELVEYKTKVSHALLSAGDKWLAVATKDGTLHIHDRASLEKTHTIAAGKEGVVITDVQFSADGQRVAVARDDTLAKIYDTAKGEEVATLKGHSGIVFAVAFSPDGKKVVTGGDDNTARVWDAATGQALATLSGHKDSVRCVAFDPSGEILVTGSTDKTVKLWRRD